jgi:hypothetical protein
MTLVQMRASTSSHARRDLEHHGADGPRRDPQQLHDLGGTAAARAPQPLARHHRERRTIGPALSVAT